MLLVDIGNTRIKSALVSNGGLSAWPGLSTRGSNPLSGWPQSLIDSAAPRRVLVANVAGAEIAGELAQFVFACWGVEAEFVRPQRSCAGMTTRYADPAQLGVDRWLAALAAWDASLDAVCVVDPGTALTVDVVTRHGEHLGGLIAPGVELMRRSLNQGTAHLPDVSGDEVAGFADNTLDAINLGCNAAVRGLLAEVHTRLAAAPKDGTFRWYLTGGGAELVAALMPCAHQHDPQLVLRGLLVVARDQT